MSNETKGLLSQALDDTLKSASLDAKAFDGVLDLPGNPQSAADCVQLIIDYYNENQAAIDSAILASREALGSPENVARIEALTTSDLATSAEADLAGLEISELITEDQLDTLTNAALSSSLKALSIGVAADVSAVFGLMAGSDRVIPLDGGSPYTRSWGAHSFGIDISATAGLVLGFWKKKPSKAIIAGFAVDVAAPLPDFFGIRFIYVGELHRHSSPSLKHSVTKTHLGVTLQLGVGVGAGVEGFVGRQMGGVEAKATMTVLNDDGNASVTQGSGTPLNVKIKTYSGSNINLDQGTTITLKMPSFFSEQEVSGMTTELDGWSFSSSGRQLTLTLESDQGVWDDPIKFKIKNVRCSSGDASGHVRLSMNGTSLGYTIGARSKLTAVAQVASMSIDWTGYVDGKKFTWKSSNTSGTGVEVYTAPKNTFKTLAEAVQSNKLETEWTLGYECQYNTVDGKSAPQIIAMIKDSSGALKYQGTWQQAGTTSAPTETDAYYQNQEDGDLWLKITNIVADSG